MKKLAPLFALAVVALAVARARTTRHRPHDYVIYGHAAHPIAVAEVTKLPMKTTVADSKQPFVQRVEQAVHSNPF